MMDSRRKKQDFCLFFSAAFCVSATLLRTKRLLPSGRKLAPEGRLMVGRAIGALIKKLHHQNSTGFVKTLHRQKTREALSLKLQ